MYISLDPVKPLITNSSSLAVADSIELRAWAAIAAPKLEAVCK